MRDGSRDSGWDVVLCQNGVSVKKFDCFGKFRVGKVSVQQASERVECG
jgi:hypothetical protein